ncbi:unnamed protein product [Chrysoparadoxa australica]
MNQLVFCLQFYLNAEKYTLKSIKPFTMDNLLEFFNYNKNLIVIEYNNNILHKENWSKIQLHDLDKIEIVTIVGGG